MLLYLNLQRSQAAVGFNDRSRNTANGHSVVARSYSNGSRLRVHELQEIGG